MKRINTSEDTATKTNSRAVIDAATYNKIQRHLTDINDVITDEDIRNIRIDVAFYSDELNEHHSWHKGLRN